MTEVERIVEQAIALEPTSHRGDEFGLCDTSWNSSAYSLSCGTSGHFEESVFGRE